MRLLLLLPLSPKTSSCYLGLAQQRLRVSGQQQQLRQFRARRSRALGDAEDDDLPLPHSGVLLCAVERRPWPPDARAPPAKDPPASRPPHAIPISPETYTKSHPAPAPPFGPRPAALQPERFGRLAPEAEERSSLPRASPAPANQQADPAS
ncbi:vegetative cell wall protein gp1-like [Triticum urartu]|uniref:vegetative cell wall protein gp1-like n=1 Tax=Triticum urartu TaxID=4572 RepID=UPI0020446914|nr:vegetative cell wall protein gp1-like [Triticum urartu]